MTTKIKKDTFSGSGHVFDGTLADALRGLAQDHARLKSNQFSDATDNSTGTASYPPVAAALAGKDLAAFTEAGTASAQDAATDTAIGKIKNAHSVLARFMNTFNGAFGLPLIDDNSGGTVATAGTIPAMDLSVSGVNTSCLNVVTARVAFEELKKNAARLVHFANRICVATGQEKITSSIGTGFDGQNVLTAITATGAAVDGTADSTVEAADITAELAAHANIVATIAQQLNDIIGAQAADLTDSTGGTAVDLELAAMPAPAAAAGAATTSAPKAGFDTELTGPIENGLAELTARVNYLLRRNNLTPKLTDSTGQTTNGTLEIIDDTLTAVDGSTGTVALEAVSAAARMNLVRDAIASIGAKVNQISAVYGLPDLVDNTGGTVSTTIANLTATATGVGEDVDGPDCTMLDSAVDAWLDIVTDNFATLAARLNALTTATNTGANMTTEVPLHTVAWDG